MNQISIAVDGKTLPRFKSVPPKSAFWLSFGPLIIVQRVDKLEPV
jgi:hypothetical protein